MPRIPHLRWLIALMLFLAAILNYIDRQTLSILAPTIQKDLNLTDGDYGRIVNLFLIAYTISLLVSGRLVDKIGTRWGMAIFVTWWSISNMLTGFAWSLASLGLFRFMLGFGEAGNWPSSTKAVSEWFNAKERAFAIGFYTMGASVGATIAPLLILFVAGRWHWQAAFVITGLLGLVWVVPWMLLYRKPENHPFITEKELATIRADAAAETRPAETPATEPRQSELRRWGDALSRKDVWALMIGRLLTDPVWFFYQFWFAKYLFSARGVQQQDLKVTWVIYLAADFGSIIGGLASGYLVKRGKKASSARMLVMLVCALTMPLSLLLPGIGSMYAVLALGMAAVLAHLAWLSNISALVVDRIPKHLVATCFGVIAAGSALGGILMNETVKHLLQNYSYRPWFFIMAALHPVAWVILWLSGMMRSARTESSR